MNKQYIQFATYDMVYNRSYRYDQYQLRPERKHVWIQKACIWVLKKLECYAIREDITLKHITIDLDKVFDLVIKQQYELCGKYLLEAERILIGYDEYAKFTEESLVKQPISFDTNPFYLSEYELIDDEYVLVPRRINGLKVTLVPWMKGVLVLPKL